MFGFEGVEFGFVAQGEADVVEAIQQAVFAERVDVEVRVEALVVGDGLGFEVDGELVLWIFGAAVEQRLYILFAEADEDDAVLARVREEDVGEGGRDDGEEAVLVERPCGVLARAAAAEVLSGDENLRAFVLGLVEDEVRPLLDDIGRFGVVAPVEEEELAVAGALDALEELLGDDLVGVDVGQRQRDGVSR